MQGRKLTSRERRRRALKSALQARMVLGEDGMRLLRRKEVGRGDMRRLRNLADPLFDCQARRTPARRARLRGGWCMRTCACQLPTHRNIQPACQFASTVSVHGDMLLIEVACLRAVHPDNLHLRRVEPSSLPFSPSVLATL